MAEHPKTKAFADPREMLEESGARWAIMTKQKDRSHEICSLLESSNFSDCVVGCGARTWKLHKAIICPRCPYFNKAFNGRFAVKTYSALAPTFFNTNRRIQEAKTGNLSIRCQDPDTLGHVIRFIYTGQGK
jgi:hypothetical protein